MEIILTGLSIFVLGLLFGWRQYNIGLTEGYQKGVDDTKKEYNIKNEPNMFETWKEIVDNEYTQNGPYS